MTQRGLVLVPDFTVDLASNRLEIRNVGGAFQIAAVRRLLPYFDKFDLPTNQLIFSELPDDLKALDGIVSSTHIAGFSGEGASIYVFSQIEAWRQNEAREPGQWALAQSGGSIWLPEKDRIAARTIELELYSALPVPGEDVALHDVLEFKQRRASELAAFRAFMDKLYLDLISSNDVPRAKRSSIQRVEESLIALNKVAAESWANRLMSSIKVDIALPNLMANAGGGAFLASQFSLPLELGAAVGAVSSAVSFSLTPKGNVPKGPPGFEAFAYAYRVEKELATG